MSELTTNKELKEKIWEKLNENHIWINAFSCINPSSKTCEDVGRMVINMLKDDNLLLPSWIGDESSNIDNLQRLTPCLYLYINKS